MEVAVADHDAVEEGARPVHVVGMTGVVRTAPACGGHDGGAAREVPGVAGARREGGVCQSRAYEAEFPSHRTDWLEDGSTFEGSKPPFFHFGTAHQHASAVHGRAGSYSYWCAVPPRAFTDQARKFGTQRWMDEYAEHRGPLDDQSDAHNELLDAIDKFLGSIERIDDPYATFVQPSRVIVRFFRQPSIGWKPCTKAGFQDSVCGQVRTGQRPPSAVFVVKPGVRFVPDGPDGGSGLPGRGKGNFKFVSQCSSMAPCSRSP